MAPEPHWLEQRFAFLFPTQVSTPDTKTNGTNPNHVPANLDRYLTAALRGVLNDLRQATEGERNHLLNISAYRLGRFVSGGGLDEIFVSGLLADVARDIGLDHGEIGPTIRSGLDAGKRDPFTLPTIGHQAATHPAHEDEAGSGLDEHQAATEQTPEPGTTDVAGLAGLVLDRHQLATLPKPHPLIADTLDLGTVSLLAGYWGTCKSFVALDWSACIATGKPWQGRKAEQLRVLYVASEGAFGLHDRLTSWERGWGTDIAGTSLHVLPTAPNLGKASTVAELCALVEAGSYQFVVVDTLAKCMVGLDENSAQDMGRVVAALYRIRAATGNGAVLAVHHTGKDKTTTRGSSALEGGVDCVYKTEGKPEDLTLQREKRKDGPTEDNHRLVLSQVPYTNSMVLDRLGGQQMDGKANELLTAYLMHFRSIGSCTSSQLEAVSGMSHTTFYRSLNKLVGAGELVNVGNGHATKWVRPSDKG